MIAGGLTGAPVISEATVGHSPRIDWRLVVDSLDREPEVPLYPGFVRVLIFAGLGLGSWAIIIGLVAVVCG